VQEFVADVEKGIYTLKLTMLNYHNYIIFYYIRWGNFNIKITTFVQEGVCANLHFLMAGANNLI